MRIIVAIQAVYYLITGIWPVIEMGTFEAVTGSKTDDWLVKMVGLLAAAIGATLLLGACRPQLVRETLVLAVLSASSFIAIDVVYALNGTISRIYLVDAVIQAALIVSLLGAKLSSREQRSLERRKGP